VHVDVHVQVEVVMPFPALPTLKGAAPEYMEETGDIIRSFEHNESTSNLGNYLSPPIEDNAVFGRV